MQDRSVMDFLAYCTASKKSPRTIKWYGESLQIFEDYLAMHEGKRICLAYPCNLVTLIRRILAGMVSAPY